MKGFSRVQPKKRVDSLATIGEGEDEHPPHWAAHFQPWQYYKTFWQRAARWLAGKE